MAIGKKEKQKKARKVSNPSEAAKKKGVKKKTASPIGQDLGDIMKASGIPKPELKKSGNGSSSAASSNPAVKKLSLEIRTEQLEEELNRLESENETLVSQVENLKEELKIEKDISTEIKKESQSVEKKVKQLQRELSQTKTADNISAGSSVTNQNEIFDDWRKRALAILNNSAIILYEAEMEEKSRDVFEKILKLDPENDLVKENLKLLNANSGC